MGAVEVVALLMHLEELTKETVQVVDQVVVEMELIQETMVHLVKLTEVVEEVEMDFLIQLVLLYVQVDLV